MKNHKVILFTFDYELFLGEKSGTVQDCLIEPTEKLVELLKRYNLKAVFFVDTVFLIRLRELATLNEKSKDDLHKIFNQLDGLVKSGHEIHPHIHAHWKDAEYNLENNEWQLNNKRYYSFASINEKEREELFSESISIIEAILNNAGVRQPIDSYRAGGWSIQPFGVFEPLFSKFRIINEWSVIPGKYHYSDAHSFDFRLAPQNYPVYHFEQDPCQEDRNGRFTEWTISAITFKPIEKWLDFKVSGILKRLGKFPAYKGRSVGSITTKEGDKYCRDGEKRTIASFEGLNPLTIRKYLSSIKKSNYFHFISHPKLLSDFEFSMIERLFGNLDRKYEIISDFRQYRT